VIRRVVSASTIGTALEWYDFMLYGTAAALVFGQVFFVGSSPVVGTLASLATFAVGFFARPVGGLLFAHIGDRYGRRVVLMITLVLMGVSSTLVGLIPSYDAIGIAAPVCLVLLRILQGLGAGAEYAGGALMAAEHAPPERRGLFAAIPPTGNALGVILAALVFTPFTWLPEDEFLAWGWRVPFLLSVFLVPIGLYIRFKVEESPAFERNVAQEHRRESVPLLTVLRTEPRTIGAGFLLSVGPNVATYVPAVFVLAYISEDLGVAAAVGTIGLLIANTIKLVTLPFAGLLSDWWGRKRVFSAGLALCAASAFPMFWLLDTENEIAIWCAMIVVLTFANDLMLGSQAAMLAEQFETRYRFTGVAFCRETAAAVAGGTLPFIAVFLTSRTGGTWAVSALMVALCGVALVGVLMTRDRDGIAFTPADAVPDSAPSGAAGLTAVPSARTVH
jgi:MHS family shikimate/dehydroshikimate transporter-like MFS transporter